MAMNQQFKKTLKIISEFIALFIIIFCIMYLVFNYSSISLITKYKFSKPKEKGIESIEKELIAENNQAEIKIEDTLIIPKLNIKAPIIFSEKEENIKEDLRSGVSHYPNTPMPGEAGNILISGHSSNYFWEKGDYNSIFANLSELKNGDQIFVYFKNRRYDYTIFENKVLSLKEANQEIFKEEDKSILNLVTCWPVGTSWKRLIIKANLF